MRTYVIIVRNPDGDIIALLGPDDAESAASKAAMIERGCSDLSCEVNELSGLTAEEFIAS